MVGRSFTSPPPIESTDDNGLVHMMKGGESFRQGQRGQFVCCGTLGKSLSLSGSQCLWGLSVKAGHSIPGGVLGSDRLIGSPPKWPFLYGPIKVPGISGTLYSESHMNPLMPCDDFLRLMTAQRPPGSTGSGMLLLLGRADKALIRYTGGTHLGTED